jgi:hypothetical protein
MWRCGRSKEGEEGEVMEVMEEVVVKKGEKEREGGVEERCEKVGNDRVGKWATKR